jgi:AraC family ethanolamine operon transcriptional activator
MDKPPETDSLPAVSVVDIDDPTEVGAGVELIDLDAVQLQSMPLRARRVVIHLESAWIVFYSTNLRIRTRTRTRNGLVAYDTYGPQTSGTVNGQPVGPGRMIAVEPGSEVTFVAEGGWESFAILLPPAEVIEHLLARKLEAATCVPQGTELLQVDPVRADALFLWGKRLVDMAVRQPGLLEESGRERLNVRHELLERLLATLRVAAERGHGQINRTREERSRIVRVAEDYALAHIDDQVYLSDLCKAADVSERSLEYAFKAVMGMTPMAYLTRLRLHRVRQKLLAAPRDSTTVTAEALNWGFWHLGEFSRAYKDCFGETPSETLRRHR